MKRWMTTLPLALIALLFVTSAQAGVARVDLTTMWLQGEELELETEQDLGPPPADRDMRISVWHDREEDDPYRRGEALRMYFRTNQDLYVVVYRIDADGYVDVLWPTSRMSDGFSYGGHVYTLPPQNSPESLRVSNSKGVEYVEAIASRYPFDLRDLGIDFAFDPDDRDEFQYAVSGDPMLAVNDINYAITGLEEDADYIVTDFAHLYVDSQVEHARYTCRQCHSADDSYHPYVDTCTKVVVYRDWGWYRNWWVSFGYYPLYCDPPYYYYDLAYHRPYVNWYYPVSYRWNPYRCYTRPYSFYYWHETTYYTGNYNVRYRRGDVRSRPLYDRERRGRGGGRPGDPASVRVADARRTRDGGLDRTQMVRGTPPVRLAADRARNVETVRGADRVRQADQPRRVGVQTSRPPRSERGQVSLRPTESGRTPTRVAPQGSRVRPDDPRTSENGGRRWTRPVVRNRDDGSTVKRPDRGSETRRPGSRVTPTPRVRENPRSSGDVRRPSRDTQKPRTQVNKPRTIKRGNDKPRTVKPRTVKPRNDGKSSVKRGSKGGKGGKGGAIRGDSPRPRRSTPSVKPSTRSNGSSSRPKATVKRGTSSSRPKSSSSVKRSSGSSKPRSSGTVKRSSGGSRSGGSSKARSSQRSSGRSKGRGGKG